MPNSGGVVELRAEATRAATCWFSVRGVPGYVAHPRACTSGVAVGSLRIGAIAPRAARRVVVTAFARRGHEVARSVAVVTQSSAAPVAVNGLGKVGGSGGVVMSGGVAVASVVRPAPPAAKLVAYPLRLTRSGGRVVARLVSFRGLACWFAVAGDLGDHTAPVPCSKGFTTGDLVLPPNRGKFARVVKIIGYVKNVDKTVRSISSVVQPGRVAELAGKPGVQPGLRPGSPVVNVASSTTWLGAGGGGLALHLAAIGAKTCWLDVPGDPAASTPRPCSDGFASLDAVLGKNTSGLSRTLTIVAFASNGAVTTRQTVLVRQASAYTPPAGGPGTGPVVVRSTPQPVVQSTPPSEVVPVVQSTPPPPASFSPPPSPSPVPSPSPTPTPSPLAITTTSLPGATVSSAYSTSLAASGGTSPYSWALGSSSVLPAGLSLSGAGVISGTPSAAGTSSLVVTVTDGSGGTASATLSLDVVTAAALTVLTTELPDGAPYSGQAGDPYSADLVASGGSGAYSWALASGSVLPAGLSLSSGGVISGTTVGYGPHSFTVVVTDTASPGSTASQALVIYGVWAGSAANWSGYVLTNGPFTAASGTFNVPNVSASSGDTYVAIWVGVDGMLDTDLIQAGVQVQYLPGSGVQIYPWWEILPAYETPISSMGTVSVGDEITVDIAQVSSGTWSIEVADDTTGQSFTTTQSYTGGYSAASAPGAGSSAEWIVERPELSGGALSTLATYSPNVEFNNIGYTGSAAAWENMAMSYQPAVGQPIVTVSSPSAIDAKGFDVAYGATPPAYPT